MIDYLSEIQLPGRMFAPRLARTIAGASDTPSLGFVAGPENRLASSAIDRLMRSASKSAAESAVCCVTPKLLALFGPSGTGKTHLAHGLVRFWNEARGAGSAAYLTANDFYRQLIDAIKRDAAIDFRRGLRAHSLLAIDDLHQLPSHDYVSQELRFTLDDYEGNGGTVVVASRRPANMLANISADVRSRLAAGLMLQLAAPGNAARVRIIRRATETLGRPISEQAASRLANGMNGTANDLFGAIFELCAAPAASSHSTSDDAEQFVAARLAHQPKLRDIVAVVARYFGVPQTQLKSKSRRRSIVTARAIAVFLARELAGEGYEQIGRALGGRDHTTIMHNYRKIERERSREPVIQEAIEELSRTLLNRRVQMFTTCR